MGLSDEYGAACDRMYQAGRRWLYWHPKQAAEFTTWPHVYGVTRAENPDAHALVEAIIAAAEPYGSTGAMVQAVLEELAA